MKRHLGLVLAACIATGASAQVVGYNFRSGDLWVDTQLGQISDYGRRDRLYFVDDLVNNFGAPRYLVNDLLDKRHWTPGDVYYATALAYSAHRPLGDAVREYDNSKGQGWGVVAQRMGIKPGSAEFHALKGQMGKSKGRYDARGPRGDGHEMKGHGNDDHQGGDKGKGNGNSQGKGNNKGKGHGH
jgi:hypothetical protein